MEKKQWKWLAISVGFSTVVLLIVLWLTIDENTNLNEFKKELRWNDLYYQLNGSL